MPRAWLESIEKHRAGITTVIAEAETRLAEIVARIPQPVEPIDPAPLIEAALAPVIKHANAAVDFAKAAMELAEAAAEKVSQPVSVSAPEQVLIVFRTLARILAVRLLLFLSLAGCFALAVMAMAQQSWLSLVLVSAFGLLTIAPLAWLEMAARPGRAPDPT